MACSTFAVCLVTVYNCTQIDTVYSTSVEMFSYSMKDKVEEKGKWPCAVCKKGVGNKSILCHGCEK